MARPKLGRGIASLLSPLEQHIQHISIDLITLTHIQEQEKENFSIAELELLAGEIDIAKWQVALPLVSGHDHPRDPEKDNVRPGDQIGGGVKFLEHLRLFGPTHRGEWPQP